MKNKKKFLTNITIFLMIISAVSVNLVSALDTLTYDGPVTDITQMSLNNVPWSTNTSISNLGMSFQASVTGWLHTAILDLHKVSTPTGELTLEICGVDGALGSNYYNGTVYATSAAVDLADVGLNSLVTFTFNATYNMTAGSTYGAHLYVSSYSAGSYTASKYVKWAHQSSAGRAGNCFDYYSSAWHVVATDLYLKVYVTDEAGATPPPVETPDPYVPPFETMDQLTTQLTNFVVPLIVTLLPVVFIWILGGRGKWPILIGICIGAGLGYTFALVPAWFLFLVTIGVVGMAYQSVRSGN